MEQGSEQFGDVVGTRMIAKKSVWMQKVLGCTRFMPTPANRLTWTAGFEDPVADASGLLLKDLLASYSKDLDNGVVVVKTLHLAPFTADPPDIREAR